MCETSRYNQIIQLKAISTEKPIFWFCCIQIFNSSSILLKEYSHNLPSRSYHLIAEYPYNDIFWEFFCTIHVSLRNKCRLSFIVWLCSTHFNSTKSKIVQKFLTWFFFIIEFESATIKKLNLTGKLFYVIF